MDINHPKDDMTNTKMSPDLYLFAMSYNFLRLTERLGYGSKHDFVRDEMQRCLNKSIISKEASEDKIWEKLGITIEDCDRVEMKYELYDIVEFESSEKSAEYWNLEFKKVVLPDGWRLEKGCGCGRNMEASSFSIYDRDQYMGTLAYFDLGGAEYRPALFAGLDLLDGPIPKKNDNK